MQEKAHSQKLHRIPFHVHIHTNILYVCVGQMTNYFVVIYYQLHVAFIFDFCTVYFFIVSLSPMKKSFSLLYERFSFFPFFYSNVHHSKTKLNKNINYEKKRTNYNGWHIPPIRSNWIFTWNSNIVLHFVIVLYCTPQNYF